MADHSQDATGATANLNKYTRDWKLWGELFPRTTAEAITINPLPGTPAIRTEQDSSGDPTPRSTNYNQMDAAFYGISLNMSAPRLNFGRAQMELGQVTHHGSRAMWDISKTRSAFLTPRRSYAEIGRLTNHPLPQWVSARAGNLSVPGNAIAAPDKDDLHQPCDQQGGAIAGYDDKGVCTNAGWNGGHRVATFTHYVSTDLPSNGFGLTYGDAHNTIFTTSLASHPMMKGKTQANYGIADDQRGDSDWGEDHFHVTWDSMWSVNQITIPQTHVSGTTLSSPDRNPHNAGNNNAVSDADYLFHTNTVQVLGVRDKPTVSASEQTCSIGPTYLGNHVVQDTCGLVGFEGTITVTGFFSISQGMPTGTQDLWAGGNGYGGLNVQVHSGLTTRRNRLFAQRSNNSNKNYNKVFGYGTDNAAAEPMTDGMKTRAKRFSSSTANANETSFFATRTDYDTKGSRGGGGLSDLIGANSVSDSPAILGDTIGLNSQWTGTTGISSAFLKDKIPTRVRIVPQIVGYEDVVVAPGTAKLAEYGDSANMTFRKPIVDYHILVSVIKPTKNIKRNTSGSHNLDQSDVGDPKSRNNPDPALPWIDANYSADPCNIFHAVFRINPTTLEQIYTPAATSLDYDYLGGSAEKKCPTSIIPRHSYGSGSSEKPTQGWGLHQITPFRPLANSAWAKIPKLSGAVEAGGFYQRGGVSHLWDAAAWGKELIVGADMTDASDFNSEVWGKGQVWPDGTNTASNPPGVELMLFRYEGRSDPFYTNKQTTMADNPLRDAMEAVTTTDHITGTYAASMDTGFTITNARLKGAGGWQIHDWVFPQKELMRYLGREDKGRAAFGANLEHPTLHCSSLSIMEDGRMMMAAIQRDTIKAAGEYPTFDIGYPLNANLEIIQVPRGYYYDSTKKLALSLLGTNDDEDNKSLDPVTGEILALPEPRAIAGDRTQTPPGTNFSRWPTWSHIEPNSSARSLILMFSNSKATAGKLAQGQHKFEITERKIGSETVSEENWTFDDTWWNGSRISYWFPESGQRAIPITYGSYPEVRCSHAVLPKCLPHIMSDLTHVGGYPLAMPLDRLASSPGGDNGRSRASLDPWETEHIKFMRLTAYIPTTIGFADFGPGANPHQEMGWASHGFPTGLYDPIDYTNAAFFTDTQTGSGVNKQRAPWRNLFTYNNTNMTGVNAISMQGPMGGFSHFGPLHYGLSQMNHPYQTDQRWTQVHGGVGYDLPLHLLIPPAVHVRARGGGSNSLDLELELPFHRTDTIEMDGAIEFNSGFDLGPEKVPNGSRPQLGNWTLDTRLWDKPTTNSANAKMGGYNSAYQRVHGPVVSGTGLTAFWADHPTDRFHAAAVPIYPDNTYDFGYVESNQYPPMLLSRSSDYSKLDTLALSEQLTSSTEVHIPHGARPFWDSGSIVTAQGVGLHNNGADKTKRARFMSEMAGGKVQTAAESVINMTGTGTTSPDVGLGKGQRIIRTPEGTLHNFVMCRAANAASDPWPQYTHYKKPVDGDMFWNRKALQDASHSTYTLKDAVGPTIASVTGSADKGRLLGAAFCSDSKGTIHAVLEYMGCIHAGNSNERAHRLYYHKADRIASASSPSATYDWDWTVHTPVLINPDANTGSHGEAAGSANDLRLPTLVCDSTDRLHLAFQQVFKASVGGGSLPDHSAIWYMNKLATDAEFPEWALDTSTAAPTTTDQQIQLVSPIMSTAEQSQAAANQASTLGQKVQFADHPKVLLRGDNIPVVTYRGSSPNFTTASRKESAIYLNRGKEGSGPTLPTSAGEGALGRIKFDLTKSVHIMGLVPSTDKNSTPDEPILFYDSIIDERNQMFTAAIWDNSTAWHRTTMVNMWSSDRDIEDQYSTATGLGVTRTLFVSKQNSNKFTNLSDVTMTTNGDGQIHMVFGFVLTGSGITKGNAYRVSGLSTESLIPTLQAPVTPSSALDTDPTSGAPYVGGYGTPSDGAWNVGGSYASQLGNWDAKNKHFLEVFMPSFEWSQAASDDHWVIRSINMRWLSVPSIGYDSSTGWFPIGESHGISGSENFPHQNPQLRYQRFCGFNANALDLSWMTNELSWMRTPLPQSRVMMPGGGVMLSYPGIDDTSSNPGVSDEIPGY